MATAEATYVDSLPAEPMTSHDWDDLDRWELGPEVPVDHFEPDPADGQWWAEFTANNGPSIAGSSPVLHEPSDKDWDEMARWSEQVFGAPHGGPITDQDVITATGGAG
jgi:hypothetical protein